MPYCYCLHRNWIFYKQSLDFIAYALLIFLKGGSISHEHHVNWILRPKKANPILKWCCLQLSHKCIFLSIRLAWTCMTNYFCTVLADIYFVDAGCSMTTVLLNVSHGRRPCVEIMPEQRPRECDQMISIMKQCWDQEQNKRPLFSGWKHYAPPRPEKPCPFCTKVFVFQ